MKSHKLQSKDMMPFILGGKALFTIRNNKTGTRFTYKVQCPKDKKPEDADIYFVKLLTGTDNENSYRYIGYVRKAERPLFYYGVKSKISKDAKGVTAFEHVFNQLLSLNKTHADLEIWHEGKCCRCGRTLTVPESIEDGIGPECKRIINKAA